MLFANLHTSLHRNNLPIVADLELPEKLTLGIRQDLAPGVRAHATVEWSNWSRLGVIPIQGLLPPAALDFQWEDGWYFALGGEYDYSDKLTLRTGFGYEISPIREPSQRLVQLPDNDRYWLSAGASYELGDFMGLLKDAKVDAAYTHVFVEEGDFSRHPSAGPAPSSQAAPTAPWTLSPSASGPSSDRSGFRPGMKSS